MTRGQIARLKREQERMQKIKEAATVAGGVLCIAAFMFALVFVPAFIEAL